MERFERKEYKYYVPVDLLEPIRKRVMTFMEHDPFCRERPDNIYSVRSIYLDTPRLLFYYEKKDGLKVRKKLRVRTYNTNAPSNNTAFLEIKRKIKSTVFKERARIDLADANNLLNGANLTLLDPTSRFTEKAALNKFIYLTKRLNLEPKVLITYEREAFVGMDDPGLRVTFDMNVRSYPIPDFCEIFREQDLKVIKNPYFVLEIKFYGKMPHMARRLVRDFGLRQQSISKYCSGIDIWTAEEFNLGLAK